MRWGRSLGLGATLVAGIAGLPACGADPESVTSASTGAMTVATTAMTETSDAPSTDGASTDVSTTATPPATEAVRVAITGVPLFADDGAVELCPYEAASCFGIAVSGGLDPTLAGETVRLVGTYDGVSVTPDPDTTAEVVEGAFDRDPDYSTPCDGMRNPSLSPDDRSTYEAIAGYL